MSAPGLQEIVRTTLRYRQLPSTADDVRALIRRLPPYWPCRVGLMSTRRVYREIWFGAFNRELKKLQSMAAA